MVGSHLLPSVPCALLRSGDVIAFGPDASPWFDYGRIGLRAHGHLPGRKDFVRDGGITYPTMTMAGLERWLEAYAIVYPRYKMKPAPVDGAGHCASNCQLFSSRVSQSCRRINCSSRRMNSLSWGVRMGSDVANLAARRMMLAPPRFASCRSAH